MGEGRVQSGGAWQSRGEHSGRGPKGYTRSDDRIKEDVCDRLTEDPSIDASDIDVSVTKCEVILSGTVEDRQAKRRAEDCAENVSGVRNVQNNLRVHQQAHETSTAAGMSNAGTRASGSSAGKRNT
jgi:osmotically-inducible protein OsmY